MAENTPTRPLTEEAAQPPGWRHTNELEQALLADTFKRAQRLEEEYERLLDVLRRLAVAMRAEDDVADSILDELDALVQAS